jgi:hypothetical protein
VPYQHVRVLTLMEGPEVSAEETQRAESGSGILGEGGELPPHLLRGLGRCCELPAANAFS